VAAGGKKKSVSGGKGGQKKSPNNKIKTKWWVGPLVAQKRRSVYIR
jgi:hypothetical protein